MTVVVMTGGTSGIGKVAASHIQSLPSLMFILGGRREMPTGTDFLPLELDQLDKVRVFAEGVIHRVGSRGIDALVLNAGVSHTSVEHQTADGFEATFGINHLAHFLLVKLLLPVMADQAIITFTTSGTHDPAERAPVPAPRHANARLLAWPAQDPDLHVSPRRAGEHAYTASKLCNLLTARYLSTLPQTISQNLSVVAYDPGATPGTGLSRSYGLVMKSAWWLLGTPIGRMIPMFSSRKDAGRGLADLVLRRVEIPPGGGYARMRRGQLVWSEPSELARDTSVAAALWHDSSQLVGIGNQTKT